MTENKSQEGTDSVARKGQVDGCGHQAPGPRGTRTLCVPVASAPRGVFLHGDLHGDFLLLNWFLHKAGLWLLENPGFTRQLASLTAH